VMSRLSCLMALAGWHHDWSGMSHMQVSLSGCGPWHIVDLRSGHVHKPCHPGIFTAHQAGVLHI
jgi:hypothetical protein